MVKVPHKTLERKLCAQGYGRIIGVDEVGMACLAGPVVVCALSVAPEFYERRHDALAGLRDSKMLQPHQRERYAGLLVRESGLKWKIALCEVSVIDEINIYQASRRAMREAIQALEVAEHRPMVIVDGNKGIHGIPFPQQAVVGGDRKVWAVAAASILAKVHRDRLMMQFAQEFPGYGFEQHKGYPTALHRSRIAELGLCPIHRRSFCGAIDGPALEL